MSLNLPLVSVIIPCYNVEEYVEECVTSVLQQTYSTIELICVDNNSSDHTYQRLEELKEKYPDIIIVKEHKAGAPAARNAGLKLAKGEWVQFLDADDILLPEKIESNMNLIVLENRIIHLLIGGCKRIKAHGAFLIREVEKTDPWLALFRSKLGVTSCILWKKSILKEVGGWNEQLGSSQEYRLLFEVLKICPKTALAYDDNVLTVNRERIDHSITHTDPVNNIKRFIALRSSIISYLREYEKEYFEEKKHTYYGIMYDHIRKVSLYDPLLSIRLYNEVLPKKYVPGTSSISTKSFLILNKILGYPMALKLKTLFN